MSKEFKLKFNNGEETLADQFEATFGSQRGTILKDYIRSLLNGGTKPAEQPEEHEDRSAKLESIMIRVFNDLDTDYKSENEFIVLNGGEVGAKSVIDRRFGELYLKCAGDDRLFLDARIEFERKYPKLARIAGMTKE
jgi:hypothetical protein